MERKIQFTPAQMKNVALGYRKVITESGLPVFDDPYMQLETAIAQVFLSWSSEKAKAYREILGISEHWGTAAIVQTMVYGNLDATAGTGVLFTSNPRLTSDRVTLWGDFAVGAQGEDIVSGLVKTRPISREQKLLEVETGERSSREMSLEEEFPEIYGPLLSTARELIYEQRWGAQEIEFTFEGEKGKDLYILQTRDMAVSQKETFLAFVPTAELAESYLVSGMGAGGVVLCGKVVFDLDDIRDSRKNDPAMPVILVRSDTVPDDIYYPEGWIARLDGNDIPIYRANYRFRAVLVPPGTHTLEFTFEPKGFAVGRMLSLAANSAVVGCLLVLGTLALRKRPPSHREPEEMNERSPA